MLSARRPVFARWKYPFLHRPSSSCLLSRLRLLFLESSSPPSAPSKNLPCSRAEKAPLEASSASEAAQNSAAFHVWRGLLLKPLPSPRQTALCLLRFLRSLQTDRRFLKRRFVRAPPAILCRSCDRRSSAQPASRFWGWKKALEKQKAVRWHPNGFLQNICSFSKESERTIAELPSIVNIQLCKSIFFLGLEKDIWRHLRLKETFLVLFFHNLFLEKRITLGAKVMYALLCNYASEKDHCWPSHATLASRLSCSISSVKNYLAELMRENLIAIRKEHYRSSVYYLIRPEHNDNANESNSER